MNSENGIGNKIAALRKLKKMESGSGSTIRFVSRTD